MARPGKPAGLVRRAETKAKKQARIDRESAMAPEHGLPSNPPARLKDRKVASAIWRKLLRRYDELETQIVSGLDWILVENFCLSVDELDRLIDMQGAAYQIWLQLGEAHKKLTQEEKYDDAVLMATQVVGAYDAYLKLDARIDRKKELLHKLGQSLYVTPRARAGAAPAKKEAPEEPDEMEKLLDDVNNFVNEPKDKK